MTSEAWQDEARRVAHGIRRRSVEVAVAKNGCYLGQSCSSAEILSALHVRGMDREAGDVFVLSPAHYALALYVTLIEIGELDAQELDTYQDDGSLLEMIPSRKSPGMLFTTGSLGQGLSQAIGLALARRARGVPGRTFVLVSDGELQEGQTWEALMSCAHYELSELTILLDLNDSQVDGAIDGVMGIEPVLDKLLAFGLDAVEVDGHDLDAVAAALEGGDGERTRAVACRTRIWEGIPSLAERHNLHFVRFRAGQAEQAFVDLGVEVTA